MELKIQTKFNTTGTSSVKILPSYQKNNMESHYGSSNGNNIEKDEAVEKLTREYSSVNEQFVRLSNGGNFIAKGIIDLEKEYFDPEGYMTSGSINLEARNYNPDDYFEPYYDSHSGEVFMVSRMPDGSIFIPNDTMERLGECYPDEPEKWFRVAEIYGNAKEINGVPVFITTDMLTGEKTVNVFEGDYESIRAIFTVGKLDNEYLFDFIEKFSYEHDMKNVDFWDRLISKLVNREKFRNTNGEDYIIK